MGPSTGSDGRSAKDSFGQLDGLARVVDVELDPESASQRPNLDLVSERRGEGVLGGSNGVCQIGGDDDLASRLRPLGLASPRAPLRLAHGPAAVASIARERQPARVVLAQEQRATVPGREL